MFYMGDCSLKEIAEFLGVSVNTVRGKLHRARRQLGSALSEHYGKLLKSHKLRRFLMQMMEQFRHVRLRRWVSHGAAHLLARPYLR